MPELPEVECLTQAVSNIIMRRKVKSVTFFRKDLRKSIPILELKTILLNNTIESVYRRSKYMIWTTRKGHVLIHLGMTGNLLQIDDEKPMFPHTHAVFTFKSSNPKNDLHLHFVDPRRFGQIDSLSGKDIEKHPSISKLGLEPLVETTRLADHLFNKSINRKTPIKNFIMNADIVVGVGNIYASESLFLAKIHPMTHAGELDKKTFLRLSRAIQKTLRNAIALGGTSFRDFKNSNGSPGYFTQKLNVYGRAEKSCKTCKSKIETEKISGRSTFFCPNCQIKNA